MNNLSSNIKENRLSQDMVMGNMMNITDKEFEIMRKLIYDNFGIHLTPQKRSLLVGRLQKQIRALGFASFGDYYRYLLADRSGDALSLSAQPALGQVVQVPANCYWPPPNTARKTNGQVKPQLGIK